MLKPPIILVFVVLLLTAPTALQAQRRMKTNKPKTPAQMTEEELFKFRIQMLKEKKLHFAGVAALMVQCTKQSERYQKKAEELAEEPKAEAQRKYYASMANWYAAQAEILKKLQPWKREEFDLRLAEKLSKSQAERLRKIEDYNQKLQLAFLRTYNQRPAKPRRRR